VFDELNMTVKFGMTSLDAEPIMSLDKFIEQTGLSAVTLWRYRKKGMLTTPVRPPIRDRTF
jgi:hypothetical protein